MLSTIPFVKLKPGESSENSQRDDVLGLVLQRAQPRGQSHEVQGVLQALVPLPEEGSELSRPDILLRLGEDELLHEAGEVTWRLASSL